jgi:tripartite-type tricarboxylate transporter receptor subunit TctC
MRCLVASRHERSDKQPKSDKARSSLSFEKGGWRFRAVCVALALLSLGITRSARADDAWPSRYVKVIVPYTAGGFSDLIARMVVEYFSSKFGHPFVVENRPGGNGVIGAGYAAKSSPDGYTLLLTSSPQVIVAPLLHKTGYNSDDLTPISNVIGFPYMLAVKASLPIHSISELVQFAKQNPGKLNYSSAGIGSGSHLTMALFLDRAGIDVVHVPYESAGPAMSALLTGEVDMVFISAAELAPMLSSGKISLLATSAPRRLPSFPQVPSIDEAYPGIKLFDAWNGLLGPRGISQPIMDQLSGATEELARSSEFSSRMSSLGVTPLGTTQAAFENTVKQDQTFLPTIIKAAGLQVDQ